MKRTLTLSLFLGLAASAVAQTPTVVEKPLPKPATAKSAAQGTVPSAKPAVPTVKVVAVPATTTKPSAVVAKSGTAKPTVIAVQPAGKLGAAAAVVPQKVAVAPQQKVTVAPQQKVTVAPAKSAAVASKPVPATISVKGAPSAPQHPVVAAKPAIPAVKVPEVKAVVPAVHAGNATDPFKRNKQSDKPKAAAVTSVVAPAKVAAGTTVAVSEPKAAVGDKKPETKKLSAIGQRDPFLSPVVRLGSAGSGCSTGKRCLAIDQIALKGVVRSETGMIAVVVNSMSKAYFLRENDPVFNGYVTKITPDSIVFKETFHDKLGKPLTRDVTKTINRPVA